MVEVVNLKTCKDFGKPGDVYIGRRFGKYPSSKWGNPYILRNDTDQEREKCIKYYIEYFEIQEHAGYLNISELKDAVRLGCWCKPRSCHGDYLKKRIEKYNEEHKDETINR